MKVIFFSTYYSEYLKSFYFKNRGLENESYSTQMSFLKLDYFGGWLSYVEYFSKLGVNAQMIIPNCRPLQLAWAKENSIKFDENNWLYSIPIAQVKKEKPDVFYLSSTFEYYGWFLDEIRKYARRIFGWISCEIPKGTKADQLDLVLSSVPYYVDDFRNDGLVAEYLNAAFDSNILKLIETDTAKDIDFSFIGNLTKAHGNRIKLVKTLVEKTPLQIFGTGIKAIPDNRNFLKRLLVNSLYQERFMGTTWGLDMYRVLQRSKITFNAHIDISKGYIGNMRMFEATGAGTLLLTDGKKAPVKMFSDDEVVYYDSVEDAIEKFNYYFTHQKEREAIAKKGQIRTLSEYNYYNVCEKLHNYFLKYLD